MLKDVEMTVWLDIPSKLHLPHHLDERTLLLYRISKYIANGDNKIDKLTKGSYNSKDMKNHPPKNNSVLASPFDVQASLVAGSQSLLHHIATKHKTNYASEVKNQPNRSQGFEESLNFDQIEWRNDQLPQYCNQRRGRIDYVGGQVGEKVMQRSQNEQKRSVFVTDSHKRVERDGLNQSEIHPKHYDQQQRESSLHFSSNGKPSFNHETVDRLITKFEESLSPLRLRQAR